MRTDLRKSPAQPGHVADEIDQVVAFAIKAFPADPTDFVVLAIGIVVAAGAERTAIAVEPVGRGGHAAEDLADQAAFAAPVTPHRAAIAVIPLRPLRGKRTALIAAHSEVPRLGDQLHRSQYRVLPDRGEEAAVAVEAVRPA